MAEVVAEALADRDVTYVVSSPLERAQETAEPIAAQFGLAIATTSRLIEADNRFEGQQVRRRRRIAAQPPQLVASCATRSRRRGASRTGTIAQRMCAAVHAARDAAAGHEAVCVSPPAPDLDAAAVRRGPAALARPAPARVRLASLTTFHFEDGRVVAVAYARAGRAPARVSAGGAVRQGALTVRRLAVLVACS